LPIRVELKALTRDDLVRILNEPESSLIKQYIALLSVEGVTLTFTPDAIKQIADLAAEINQGVENIGARRLHTVLEKLLEEISFDASERAGESITINADMVTLKLSDLVKNSDLRKFIL
jgi:ATP-dependent HslUV protease ATP-binding subunit HslU